MGPGESSSHVRRCQQVSGFPQLDVPQSTRGQDIGVETLQRPAHSQHTWYGMILAALGQMPNEVEDPLQSCRNPLSRRDTNYSTQEMLPWQHRLAATIHSVRTGQANCLKNPNTLKIRPSKESADCCPDVVVVRRPSLGKVPVRLRYAGGLTRWPFSSSSS